MIFPLLRMYQLVAVVISLKCFLFFSFTLHLIFPPNVAPKSKQSSFDFGLVLHFYV